MSREYIPKCVCGEVIPEDDIYVSNRSNEEGEEYCVIDCECPNCKATYEFSEWGECEGKDEAKEMLFYYLKENYFQ